MSACICFLRQRRAHNKLCGLAAETLGNFGAEAKKALPALEETTKDENEEVKMKATGAIQKIKTGSLSPVLKGGGE